MHPLRVALPVVAALFALGLAARHRELEGALTTSVLGLALVAQLILLPLPTLLEHVRARALGLHLLGPAAVSLTGLGLALLELRRLDAQLTSVALDAADLLFFSGAGAAARVLEVALLGAACGLVGLALSGAFAALRYRDCAGGRGFSGAALFALTAPVAAVLLLHVGALAELRRAYRLAAAPVAPALYDAYARAAAWLDPTPLVLIAAVLLAAPLLALRARQARFLAGPRLAGAALGVLLALLTALAPAAWRAAEGRVHLDHATRLSALALPTAPVVEVSDLTIPYADGARARREAELPSRGAVHLALAADASAAQLQALAFAAADRGLRLSLIAQPPPLRLPTPSLGRAPSPPLPVALPLEVGAGPPEATLGPGALRFTGRTPTDLGQVELAPSAPLRVALDARATAADLARLLAQAARVNARVILARP